MSWLNTIKVKLRMLTEERHLAENRRAEEKGAQAVAQ
jgi:hypothetical protein